MASEGERQSATDDVGIRMQASIFSESAQSTPTLPPTRARSGINILTPRCNLFYQNKLIDIVAMM